MRRESGWWYNENIRKVVKNNAVKYFNMVKQVIKRDGIKEDFNGEKMRKSIEVAAISAGFSMDRTNEVADKILNVVLKNLNDKEEVATSELSESVFSQLNAIEPKMAELWKQYEEEKRHRSA